MGNRSVSPVISVILMVAVVVILAATISVIVLDFTEDLGDPGPNVADTTGKFEPEPSGPFQQDNQIVRITHKGGDSVAVEEIEIIVRASGPGDGLPTEARLINLPSTESSRLLDENIDGNDGLISQGFGSAELIVDDGTDVWSAGKTIEFRINTGTADFRDSAQGEPEEADELEVIVVHNPSNAIISEHTFTP